MKSRWDAGQFKLKGRKEKLLSCRCCTIQDFRQEYKEKIMNKDIEQCPKEISELDIDEQCPFDQDCQHHYGKILTGKYKHYCNEFDGLPIDETCIEFAYCLCFETNKEIEEIKNKLNLEIESLNNNG